MNDHSEDTGHADDIVPIAAYEAPRPTKKEFLPWHLPRKQYVRHHQWCEQVNLMLEDAPLADGTLKYLGLPGIDLLDLRYFHRQVCETRNINLRFLGFNMAAQSSNQGQTELNISLDEVRRMPLVDQRSQVLGDDFARVANDKSMAWRKARELGPYDVINLDFCDGFGRHAPDSFENTHYNAVNRLMSLQARRDSPWLLLLTTRAGQQHIHPKVLETLIYLYLDNLIKCPPFKEKSQEVLNIENEAALRTAAATADGILPVFLCGLCKWLVGIALGHRPPTKMAVRSVIGYRVDHSAKHEDLISLAVRFTPTFEPTDDPTGLARPSTKVPDECLTSVKALNRIARRKDADRILRENVALNDQMVDAMAGLLELARYDPEEYRVWLLKDFSGG